MAKQESCLLIIVKSLILISLLISALIAGFFYVKNKLNEYFNRGNTIVVPDFRGKHLVQVFKEKPPDLLLEKAEEKYDSRYPKDHVISQNPAPGTKVKPNKKVLLVISSGSKPTTVPDLTNKTLREARILLFNNQLQEGDIAYIYSHKFSKDRIISQNPLPSMNQVVHGKVSLLVSKGQPKIKKLLVPNIIGRNLNEASELIQKLGLKVGKVLSYKDPSKATLTIISTNPAPFESVIEGTSINILVSSGIQEGNAKPSDLPMFMFTKDLVTNIASTNLLSSTNNSTTIGTSTVVTQNNQLNPKQTTSSENNQAAKVNLNNSSVNVNSNSTNLNNSSNNNINIASTQINQTQIISQNLSNTQQKTNNTQKHSSNNQINNTLQNIINNEYNASDENDSYYEITSDTPAIEDDYPQNIVSNKPLSNQQTKRTIPNQEFTDISFVMPDGFMPKEVKFVHISSSERKQIYSGVHKPLEFIKVTVPKVKGSKVHIYINDIPIEERNLD